MLSVPMNIWKHALPSSQDDILVAHAMLMAGLVEHPGQFRTGGASAYFKAAAWCIVPGYEITPLYSIKNLSIRFKNDTNLKQNDTN